MQISANIRELKKEAKRFHAEAEQARAAVNNGVMTSLEKAWQCGQRLNAIKSIVGHGNFLTWMDGNWPELSVRSAQVYMRLDRENPNAQRAADLKFDSLRKFNLSFVPEKDRPKLKDDKKFQRSTHHLAVVTDCNKLTQRIDSGQYAIDERELLRDFKPFYNWLTAKGMLSLDA